MVKHLSVRGTVQGVGYRYSMFYAAKNYGVTGWVRNRSDGSVEAMVEGPDEAVEKFIEWARKGPSLCKVEAVDIDEGHGHYDEFEIQPTL